MTPATFTVAGITFNSGAAAFTINPGTAGTNGFTLTTGITNSSTSLETINDNIALSGTDTIVTKSGGGNLTLGGTISGTGALTTGTSTGTLTLSGANIYTGGTTVAEGVVVAANTQALGAVATDTVTIDSATLDLKGGSSTVGYNTVVNGAAFIDVDNASSGAGVTYTLGTLTIGHEILTVAQGANNTGGGGLTFAGFTPTDGAGAMSMNFNFGQTTQYGTQFGVTSIIQNGFTTGQLSTVSIDPSGVVSAVYTNGRSTELGQLAIANFPNPQGLQQLGDTNWAQTFSSGTVVQGTAGSAGFGSIQSSALESSNVDLTTELVNMITEQRAFQANAQVITTADQMSQTVIGIATNG